MNGKARCYRSLTRGKLLLLCGSVLLWSCDAYVAVEGRLLSPEGEPIRNCSATLFRAEEGEAVANLEIEASFNEAFATSPAHADFFVEIACEGYQTYRSAPFYSTGVLGEMPAQLGEIVLTPQASSGSHEDADGDQSGGMPRPFRDALDTA